MSPDNIPNPQHSWNFCSNSWNFCSNSKDKALSCHALLPVWWFGGWTRSNGTDAQSQVVPSVPSPDRLAPQMQASHPLSSTLFCNSYLCVLPVCRMWAAWEQQRCLALCSEQCRAWHVNSERKKVKSLSHVPLFATPWTVAHQAPLSMEFSRQVYWSGLPYPSPGDLPDPGIEPRSPALQADALPSEPPGKLCWQCLVVIRWMNPLLARGGIRYEERPQASPWLPFQREGTSPEEKMEQSGVVSAPWNTGLTPTPSHGHEYYNSIPRVPLRADYLGRPCENGLVWQVTGSRCQR